MEGNLDKHKINIQNLREGRTSQYGIKAYSCKFKTEQWKFYSAIHEDTKHLCNILALMSVCIMDDSNSD